MRVHVLGSGAGKPVPRPFCSCRGCCMARDLGGRTRRTRTSVNIYLADEQPATVRYKVDLSPDGADHAVRFGEFLAGLEHLLITHADGDHLCSDFLAWRKRPLSGRESLKPLNLWATDYTLNFLAGEKNMDFDACAIVPHPVAPFERFRAGGLEVSTLAARHVQREPCLNFAVAAEGRTVLLAWDTGYWAEETWQAAKAMRFDAVLLECTINGPAGRAPGGGHMDVENFLRLKERMHAEGIIARGAPFVSVHMGDNGMLSHEEAEQQFVPHGVTVGYDGMLLELPPA